MLTHWGQVTHICVDKLTIIGSDNGLSPERHQAIIWTNVGILLIGPLGTNFSEIWIEIQTFSLKKIRLKMSSTKCGSFHLALNVLMPLLNFCIFQDDSNTTCETLPGHDSRHVEVIWTFPSHPSSFNQFRVVISGSQPCYSINTSWFVRGDVPTGVPSECAVQEFQNENLRTCALTCECVDPSTCGYLHYRVQFPPWVTTTLALCHYELTTPYPGVVNPELVIYWCVLAQKLYIYILLNSSSRPGQNDRHFAYDSFRCIFVDEKFCISITILLKFVAKGSIDNNPVLVCRRIGDRPLSEPMLTRFTDAYMRH